MRRSLGLVFVLLAGFAIVPSTVFAQASIAGVVKDASGAVLPGVSVEAASPALLEKSRTAVTDGSGQYKIEALRPGTYSVTFELTGFSTVKRDGVELTGTFTAQINAEMKVGAVTETITVTGETPIVDVQNTKQQYVIGQELMRALPSSGNLQSIASLLPSVIRGTVDVGGLLGESGSSTGTMTTHGNSDVRTEVGGISVHATQGSGTNNLGNGAAYQEMQVDTSGVSAEQKEGGIRMNMVPRDGGNTFQGHFLTAFANESTQGNNITPELTAAGFVAPNSLRKYVEINPSGGGPIIKDKIWFYGTYRYNHAADNAPVFFNLNAGNPNAWTYVPDVARGNASNDNLWKSTNERITWQATAKNKIGFSYDYASSCPCPRSLTATTSPESNVSNYAPIVPGKMLFLDWTAPLTNRLLFEAGFMKRDSQSSRPLTNIYFTNDPGGVLLNGVTEQSSGLTYRASSAVATSSQNPTRQPRLTVSYITGAHSLKAGFNLAFQNNEQKSYSIDAPLWFRFNNGVPNQMTLVATPFETFIHEQDHGAFVQDRWTVNRLTVTGGLRFDYFKVEFPAQGVGPGPLAPTRNLNYPETFGPTWKDLEPRVGLAWDVRGNGRTAVKLSANKYLAFFGAPNASTTFNSGNTFTTNMNPLALLVNSTTRSWTDRNGNFIPDCNILNPAAQTVTGGDVCGAMANPAFGTSVPGASYDPATLSGWNKRPDSNWQFSAGVQQQVLPRVSVDVSYFRTVFINAIVQDDLSVGPADYDTFSITAPLDSRLPGGGGYAVPGITNLKPTSFGRVANNYITFADNFGSTVNHWNGFDVTVVMRPKSGLMIQGGTSTGRTSTNTCALNQPLPEFVGITGGANPAAFCDQKGAWLTQLKVISSYTVPKADVQVSATVQSVPGPNVLANLTATNAIVQPSLGRPLSGGVANISVSLIEPNATYGERMNELDLRLTKTLKFAKTRTNIGVDLYNVLNGNAVLTQSAAFATWQRPTKILGPRFARFVATFDF